MLNFFSSTQILELIEQKLPDRLELLKLLVSQNSFTINIEGVHKVQSILEDNFWALGLKTYRIKVPERADILVAETLVLEDVATEPRILLVGHADTVHSSSSSFKDIEVLDQGKILKGPGVLDMKGGLIEILLILDVLKSLNFLNRIPIRILINSCEENSTPISAKLVQEVALGSICALVFEIGRPNQGIVTQRKGITEFVLSSIGKSSHSGNAFYEGINAILPLCRTACYLETLIDPQKGLTINIAKFEGGEHLCIVPNSAKLGVEVRYNQDEYKEYVFENIKNFLSKFNGQVLIDVTASTPPLNKTTKTEELFLEFKEVADQYGFNCQELERVGGISDANLIGSLGIPTLDALGPCGDGAHTNQEFIYVDSIKPRVGAVVGWLISGTRP